MNPNDSSVASAPTPGSNTSPVFRNGTAGAVGEGDVRLQADEYKSLLLLAQRGIKSMQEAAL